MLISARHQDAIFIIDWKRRELLWAWGQGITLVSGDTSPQPTIVLRLSLTDGGPSSNATVNFSFDFDVNAAGVSVVGSTGTFGVAPVAIFTFDPIVSYNCTTGPCTVDVQFQFASMPAYGDFRDTVNQFVDSPGAPSQTLRGNFSVPEPGLALLLGAALGAAVRRRGRRDRAGR